MSVEPGQQAPDFELKDQNRQPVRLSSYRNRKNVLLIFYPFTFTPTCQGELSQVRDELPSFANDDVETIAVSVDSVPAHRLWADQQGFTFPLLADFWPHGEVARTYGVFDEKIGAALRGTFIIDKVGVVRYKVVNAVPNARDQAEYVKVLESL
jgi:mycoredoxin-dependent peroxiredoxin